MPPVPTLRKLSLKTSGRENWVRDSTVTQCSVCSADFGLLKRKHHCRACGIICCWKCSNNEIQYTPQTRTNERGYKEKRKRVCDTCFTSITDARTRAAEAKKRGAPAKEDAHTKPTHLRNTEATSVGGVSTVDVSCCDGAGDGGPSQARAPRTAGISCPASRSGGGAAAEAAAPTQADGICAEPWDEYSEGSELDCAELFEDYGSAGESSDGESSGESSGCSTALNDKVGDESSDDSPLSHSTPPGTFAERSASDVSDGSAEAPTLAAAAAPQATAPVLIDTKGCESDAEQPPSSEESTEAAAPREKDRLADGCPERSTSEAAAPKDDDRLADGCPERSTSEAAAPAEIIDAGEELPECSAPEAQIFKLDDEPGDLFTLEEAPCLKLGRCGHEAQGPSEFYRLDPGASGTLRGSLALAQEEMRALLAETAALEARLCLSEQSSAEGLSEILVQRESAILDMQFNLAIQRIKVDELVPGAPGRCEREPEEPDQDELVPGAPDRCEQKPEDPDQDEPVPGAPDGRERKLEDLDQCPGHAI